MFARHTIRLIIALSLAAAVGCGEDSPTALTLADIDETLVEGPGSSSNADSLAAAKSFPEGTLGAFEKFEK